MQVVPHQYTQPGWYRVWINYTLTGCVSDPFFSKLLYADVQVPQIQCTPSSASTTTRLSTAAEEAACEPPCKLRVLGFCVLTMSEAEAVEEAWNNYQELKKAYKEAKKIVDPIARKKELEKIEKQIRSAKAEYEKLLKQQQKETKENAQTLEMPKNKLWKEVNKQLAPY
jgi:hypothetical protein